LSQVKQTITINLLALLLYASAAKADIIEDGAALTQRCINAVLMTSWPVDHNPDRATDLAVKLCEPGLMAVLLHSHPDANTADISAILIKEASRQMHLITEGGR
jgi:hypothetical protein